MKSTFVETRNWHRFKEGLSGLQARGAQECRLIVVDGKPGLGKTTILSRWATRESCIYLRAKTEWKPYWLLREILRESGVTPPHGYEKCLNQVLQVLGQRSHQAELQKRQFALVIDEADHISTSAKLVETVRDLTDLSGVTVVLVGMGRIRENLSRFPQTTSRVSRYVRFEPGEVADVQLFLDKQCEVAVAPDLAAYVCKVTGGFNREIREAIIAIERHGFANDPADPDLGLTVKEMDGQHLINDRETGQPIVVRAL